MTGIAPRLSIQTASLYASGETSTFTGTGGPFGFSPFTGQFGGTISSAGLATEPFNDTVFTTAPGDEVTFVIAVQNLTAGASAYSIRLQDIMPTGFVVPTEGLGLSVTDGQGNALASSGDLFGASGLLIGPALAGYDANSGLNVDLVTFSLAAGTSLPGPYASLTSTASLAGYAASSGGANLLTGLGSGAAPTDTTATTTIVTGAPTPVVTPETDPEAVATGQTISFDVSLNIPVGVLTNLRIAPVLPTGGARLSLVSSSVVAVGAGLQASAPTMSADGSISFGSVSHLASATGSAAISARITVLAGGTASGPAALQTVVSAAANVPGGVWSATVSSNVGVVAPPPPPVLSGLSGAVGAVVGHGATPFSLLAIGNGDQGHGDTVAITLQDLSLGSWSALTGAAALGAIDAATGTFTATGSMAELQAAVRALQFVPGVAGTEHFTLTLVDGLGGVVQDAGTTLSATVPAPVPTPPPPVHFPASPDPLFDSAYYLAHNPDVAAAGVDPYAHFRLFGWHEGRNPNALFDTNYYLTKNADVKAANVDPLQHFEQFGWKEGRSISLVFDNAKYNAAYADIRAANVDPLLHYMQYGQAEGRAAFLSGSSAAPDPLINAAYYDRQLGASLIPTGTAGASQAASSYHGSGWQNGLNPSAFFDTNYYLSHNPDVAAAHVDPLLHYEQFGWHEGRDPSAAFSIHKYLAAYGDVKAAGVDPLLHFVAYGQSEGRLAFAA